MYHGTRDEMALDTEQTPIQSELNHEDKYFMIIDCTL